MKFDEFKILVENAYHKYFPESRADVYIFNCLGRTIYIDCYLAKDGTEVYNGIAQNDMFVVKMYIALPNDYKKGDDLPENFTLEFLMSYVKTKPEQKYMAFGSESIRFRKTSGSPDKIVKSLDKYFKRLYDTVVKLREEDRIHEEYAELLGRKIA